MIEIFPIPRARIGAANSESKWQRPPTARPCSRAQQRGAIAIIFALMLIVMLGFCGMALDLARLYNRKVEIQRIADAAAIAAARELNGTAAGVTNALTKAANAAISLKYQYHQASITWSNLAIKFGVSSAVDGTWLDAGAATTTPDGLLFVKIETSELDAVYGTVNTVFMGILSSAFASTFTSSRSIAGRSSIAVTPLAVCALSAVAASSRNNPGFPPYAELVEYGFRRGVGYDLMQLNPFATTAENFVVDPIDPPGVSGASSNLAVSMVGPFICSGKMAMPRVTGGTITVGRPFPIGSLYKQLNSRFDIDTGGLCEPAGAQPDANVKQYVYTSIPWMGTAPGFQGAKSMTTGSTLWTVADPFPAPGTNTATMYGPLWSFARAVPYSAYSSSTPEPAAGYTPFATATWSTLYKPGVPVASGTYPAGVLTPYQSSSGSHFKAPPIHPPGVRYRRVLNVPLLACPVGAGATSAATVLAIGKFFMTVPATATSINVEFAGVVPEQALGGQVDLFP